MALEYQKRLPEFERVKTRICAILLDFPSGLTVEQITSEYFTRYRHYPQIGNRLRELRQAGDAISFNIENSKRLKWRLSDKWKFKP